MESATTPSSARRVLILLVVLSGALLAMAIVQRDRALQRAYEDGQRRAELYANTVLRSSLTPFDVTGPLQGERAETVLAEVRGAVLTDTAVARVRLWGSDGALLLSTDPADRLGDHSEDPSIRIASGGLVKSRLAVEPLSRAADGTAAPGDTPLFQTFVPLRVQGSTSIVGAAEIEQFAAALEEESEDPWWIVQTGASAVTVLLALMALISVARSMRRPARAHKAPAEAPRRRRRKGSGFDGDAAELRQRLERETTRANEAEEAARSLESRLQQVTGRLESLEGRSPDDRVDELREALRRSEAERAMLRAGRPETLLEAQMRQLHRELREAQSRAKAAELLVADGGDLTAVQEQLTTAARQVDAAVERAKVAEGRADAAEERAASADDMATAAERRIDLLEAKLQEIASSGLGLSAEPDRAEAERLLSEANERASEMERRANEAEGRLAGLTLEGPSDDLFRALEERIVGAEQRALEAETRVRAFEDQEGEHGSVFRHRLGLTAAGRKLAAPPAPEQAPELDLRAAIARSLRAPLTRASGLALSLQGVMESTEGKGLLRQLSASLRRLGQLAADLHDAHRIADGTLPLNRRRTDLKALVSTTIEEADHMEDRLIRLDADTVHAVADPARVRQIVEGMMDAAKERTRSGAAIVVRVRDADAGAWISVEDDNKTPALVGPELSLASRLAELHGTELVADGSSFRVVFARDDGL